MWLRSSILLLALLVCGPAWSGTITRSTKSSPDCGTGTTAFVDGKNLCAADLNTDLDNVYTEINGQIESANIADGTIVNADVAAGAAIVYSKFAQTAAAQDADIVDDYSADEDEQDNSTDPGDSITPSVATNLEEELERLRYKIEELTVGASASAVATGGGTDTDAYWIDGPVRGPNLIYNGGFDVWTSSTPSAGDGWSLVGTPSTLASENLVESEGQGDGQGINIIADAATEGISQTLDGLKADTTYLAKASVRDDVGTCSIGTSGADTNELTVVSDDSGSWQVLSGIFETDSTPTDVVIQLLAVANTNDCVFDHVGVWEINGDPLPYGPVAVYDVYTGTDNIGASLGAVPGLSVAFTPPGPGWIVQVGYNVNVGDETTGDAQTLCLMDENGTNLEETTSVHNYTAGGDTNSLMSSQYLSINPAAGTALSYTVECEEVGNGVKDMEYNNTPSNNSGSAPESNMWLLAYPPR